MTIVSALQRRNWLKCTTIGNIAIKKGVTCGNRKRLVPHWEVFGYWATLPRSQIVMIQLKELSILLFESFLPLFFFCLFYDINLQDGRVVSCKSLRRNLRTQMASCTNHRSTSEKRYDNRLAKSFDYRKLHTGLNTSIRNFFSYP